jgi:hypothetical protein
VYRKILSLFGLAFVAAVTAIAHGLPPAGESVSAAPSDVMVSVRITGGGEAIISAPADRTMFFDGNNNTATIDYAGAAVLSVRLIAPDSSVTEIYSFNHGSVGQTGSVTIPLSGFLSGYGNYTIEVDGYDSSGVYFSGDATSFRFHAISSGPDDRSNVIRIHFGPVVCRLEIQVFAKDDVNRENLLINYFVNDLSKYPGYPAYVDIEIPGFNELDPNQQYAVFALASDCSGGFLEGVEFDMSSSGTVSPPTTGALSIFGLGLSRADYLITSLVIFFAAVVFAFFLIRRKKEVRRR